MTAPQPAASRRGPLLTIAAIVILAVAGIGLWYLFFRPAGPAPVSLGSATPTEIAGATAVAEASADPSADSASADPSTGGGETGAIAGTWAIDPSVGSFDDFS